MSTQVYDKVRDLIFRTSGIALGDHKESFIEARMFKRMRALGLSDIAEYYGRVLEDYTGRELEEMLNAIATNVTYFFREPRHFEYLRELIREKAIQRQNEINIWSAGCSTGEEPYSIAITIVEQVPPTLRPRIAASDISTMVLEVARFGAYEAEKTRHVPEQVIRKYFQKGLNRAENLVRLKKEVRDMVDFHQVNLATPPFPIPGKQDVIFCRNVMIYFTAENRRRLVAIFKSMLKPRGVLILGSSESIVGQDTDFSPVGASIYRLKN